MIRARWWFLSVQILCGDHVYIVNIENMDISVEAKVVFLSVQTYVTQSEFSR
jgi:hypothetical protein